MINNQLKIQEMVAKAREVAIRVAAEQRAIKEQEEQRLREMDQKFDQLAEERFDEECGPLPVNYPCCKDCGIILSPSQIFVCDDCLNEKEDDEEDRIVEGLPKAAPDFKWNEQQLKAISYAMDVKQDFCLIGAAGTGKTTTEKAIIQALIQSGDCPPMKLGSKFLSVGSPAFAIVSFTRRAVQAAKRQLPADLQRNCLTIHKLLEYEPVFYEVLDPQTGLMKKTMRFEPMRGESNPIEELTTVLIDESSMCDTDLHAKLKKACPNARFIYVGDIQQLPPVYGTAILGYKMLEIPVVELTEVYRQALESPIIRLAHRILSGSPIAPADLPTFEQRPELVFHTFKKRVQAEECIIHVKKFFSALCREGKFNPDTDVVLCPFNEAFGTLELNRAMAQTLGEMRGVPVYEIIAGFQKHYLAVGDRVLVDKQDGVIKEIVTNGLYVGKRTHKPSVRLNRYGNYIGAPTEEDLEDDKMNEDDIERMLELTSSTDDEERKNQASHIVKIAPIVNGEEYENFTWDLSTAGELNSLLFSYALTVHKSQGSEWERVYFVMHHSHNTMCQREMLYTAVTRAKKYLYIICEGRSKHDKEDSTFETGIRNQRIKGNTLAEKAEWFKGKIEEKTSNGKG